MPDERTIESIMSDVITAYCEGRLDEMARPDLLVTGYIIGRSVDDGTAPPEVAAIFDAIKEAYQDAKRQ